MILFILLFLSILLTFALSWIGFVLDKRRSNVPGPVPLPIIGNGHKFLVHRTKFLEVLSKYSKKYNSAFTIYILNRRYVSLNHPKYIEPIVSSAELIVKGRSYETLKPWLGTGLLTSTGNKWKSHRKFLTPAFHFNILQSFLPVFLKNEKVLINKLKGLAGTTIDLFPIIALAALDNVTESIMGVSFHAQKNDESNYVKAVDDISRVTALKMRNPFLMVEPIYKLLPHKTRQDKALDILHKETKKVIATRRRELENFSKTQVLQSSDIGIKNKHAFLDLLLLAEIDDKRLDDETIREEVDTFMFEGHDTTTSGIVFTLYCISLHKEVQENILNEQQRIFGQDMERDPTYNEVQQMKYLELVIKESLRLYPPVPIIERHMADDTEAAGLKLLKETGVLINFFEMQRNPDVFEDPLEFRPERFEKPLSNPYSWLAFSAGPRNCIGQRFAMMEMKVTISAIVKNFKIEASDVEPKLCADLILRSDNGVFVKFVRRESNKL